MNRLVGLTKKVRTAGVSGSRRGAREMFDADGIATEVPIRGQFVLKMRPPELGSTARSWGGIL